MGWVGWFPARAVIEIRTSGMKICGGYQRATWKSQAGIGSWLVVMNALGFMAVLTNASMITFVGDMQASTLNVPEDERDTIAGRTRQWQLWMTFVIIEHVVLMLRVSVILISPELPRWIIDADEILMYRVSARYKTKEELAAENRALEQYKEKMNNSIRVLRMELLGKTREELDTVLDAADKDGDRLLSIADLGMFMEALGVEFTEKELSAASNSMSAIDDGEVTFEEFYQWLEDQNIWKEPSDSPQSPVSRTTSRGSPSPKSEPVGDVEAEANGNGDLTNGNGYRVAAEGDTFEMEDDIGDNT
jgi:hypothetical protein